MVNVILAFRRANNARVHTNAAIYLTPSPIGAKLTPMGGVALVHWGGRVRGMSMGLGLIAVKIRIVQGTL